MCAADKQLFERCALTSDYLENISSVKREMNQMWEAAKHKAFVFTSTDIYCKNFYQHLLSKLLPTCIVETTDNSSKGYQSMYDRIIDKFWGLEAGCWLESN